METNHVIPAAQVAEMEAAGSSVAIGEQGETVEVWEYFAENINDFATAKTIVDHFVDNPRLLDSRETDLHGLFVRAKLTIKRQQIAYAQAQAAIAEEQAAIEKARAAIATAREQSRGVRGVLKSFKAFNAGLRTSLAADATPIAIGMGFALLYWFR
jgi:hypothetical protein